MGWGPFQFPVYPEQASEHAGRYDALFVTISILTVVFTVLVYGLVGGFALYYRRGRKVDRTNQSTHSASLEAVLMGVPLVLAVVIFVWSSKNFIDVRTMPKDGMEIFCIGKQWMWHFQHLDGTREMNELHVPVGKPVKLTMISQDVLHSMYLPEMRAQFHVVPGRYTELAFTPIKPGRYKILCAMHCGTGHSEMIGSLYVMSPTEWSDWLAKGGNRFATVPKTMIEEGKKLYMETGCGNCHTGVDNPRGPTLAGLTGKTRKFLDGSSAIADRDYIRESILNPHRRITSGYENTMPIYQGQISEMQAAALLEYLATMGGGKGAYERDDIVTGSGARDGVASPVDTANKNQSAGHAQFRNTEDTR